MSKEDKSEISFASLFSRERTQENENITNEDKDIEETINKTKETKPKLEDKIDDKKVEEVESKEKKEPTTDTNEEVIKLKKALEETKAWGHKRNSAYVNAKKKMTDFLNKMQEDGSIFDDDVKEALGFFNYSSEDEQTQTESNQTEHPYVTLKQNLDKEFSMFKKYTKTSEADEKYNAYFSFLPLHSIEEQERILTYLSEESPDVALDHIMTTGTELYEDLYKELDDKGGILPYVKSLKSKLAKLDKKNKELESELAGTTEKVYARSSNSRVSDSQSVKSNTSFAELFERRA